MSKFPMLFKTCVWPRFQASLAHKNWNSHVPVVQDFVPRTWPIHASRRTNHATEQFTVCNIKCGQLLFEDFPVARCEACHWGFSDMVTFDSKIVTFASKDESTLNTNMPHTWLDLGAMFLCCRNVAEKWSNSVPVLCQHLNFGKTAAQKKKTQHSNFDTWKTWMQRHNKVKSTLHATLGSLFQAQGQKEQT